MHKDELFNIAKQVQLHTRRVAELDIYVEKTRQAYEAACQERIKEDSRLNDSMICLRYYIEKDGAC